MHTCSCVCFSRGGICWQAMVLVLLQVCVFGLQELGCNLLTALHACVTLLILFLLST